MWAASPARPPLLCAVDGKKGSLPIFVQEVQTLSEAAKQSCGAYQWLPPGVLPALACVAAASIWRPTGKFSPAKALLASGLEHLRAAEISCGIDLKVRFR
jgi:hypothetical protein